MGFHISDIKIEFAGVHGRLILKSSLVITALTILFGDLNFVLVEDLNAAFGFFFVCVVCGIKNGAGVVKTTLFSIWSLRNEIVVAGVPLVGEASLLFVDSS